MIKLVHIALAGALACASVGLHAVAAPLQPIRAKCTISAGDTPGTLRLQIDNGECQGSRHCGSSSSDERLSRFTGISLADLARQGAQLTASLAAEAGTFTCSGTVRDGSLSGDSLFTPDTAFAARMDQMGFAGFDSDKLLACAFLNVESAWARSLQQAGVKGLTNDNLIALRVFNVDPAYIQSMTALGYALPSADQLIALKSQGVDPAEVREIRALGYKPTLDELVQIRIFKITPDFIQRMQARGLKDLTIAKLVQIRIFKLAE